MTRVSKLLVLPASCLFVMSLLGTAPAAASDWGKPRYAPSFGGSFQKGVSPHSSDGGGVPFVLEYGPSSGGGFRAPAAGASFGPVRSVGKMSADTCDENPRPSSRKRDVSLVVNNVPSLKETWCTWHNLAEAYSLGAPSLLAAQLAACMRSRAAWP
jgi:hypothetical protein